jgi:hypothetical protein
MEDTIDGAVCANIGPRERRLRNIAGIIGTVITMLVVSALIETHAPRPYRLLLGIPVYLAAVGFLQARAQTCIGFARKGIRVLGDSRSNAEQVVDDGMKKAIASQARKVQLQTLGVTAAAVLLAIIP